VITDPPAFVDRPAFEAVWPAVSTALSRTLRRRGVPASVVDDIVQETALRTLSRRVAYTDEDDLLRWAQVVAWRLAVDSHRRTSRIADDPVSDRPAAIDVAGEVEARVTLAAVAEAITTMSASDQAALLGFVPIGSEPDRTVAVRLAVRRHRARKRLLAIVNAALGGIAVLRGLRRITAGRVVAAGSAFAVIAMVGITHLPSYTSSPSPTLSAQPMPVAIAVEFNGAADAPPKPHAGAGAAARSPATRVHSDAVVASELVRIRIAPTDGDGVVREKDPTDHFACADTIVAGRACADLPVKITR
jgi:hypothetical protein